MKKIYLLLALGFISGSVAAQTDTIKTKTEGITYGIRAGVNLSKPSFSSRYWGTDESNVTLENNHKIVTSFNFGGYANIPVSGKFAVQPGLSLSGKGWEVEGVVSRDQTLTVNGMDQYNVIYLELPVNGVFNFNGFYIGAGPYVGYAIAGKYKAEIKSAEGQVYFKDDGDVEIGNDDDDDVKPFDFGVNAMAGYQLANGLNFGLNYGFGLASFQTFQSRAQDGTLVERKANNRVFSVLVGFSF